MSSIQIVNRETIAERKFPLKYFSYQILKEGETTNHEAEVYYRPDATAVLLVDEERKKFLLTKQFRLPTYLNGNESGDLIEVCAGLIDEGETPEQAAVREAEEELGYKIANLQKAGRVFTSAGGITELVHLFTALYKPEMKQAEGGGLEEEGEDIQLLEMDFDEARQKLQQGAFIDAKTVLLLQHYFLFGYQKQVVT
jgi:GDP-mannose pyrophosphatase NudK